MSITTQTRWDSYEKLNKKRLYELILQTLRDVPDGLTAREVAIILYNQGYLISNERQATAPRMTELVDKGEIVVIGKREDAVTGKNVAIYSLK